MNTETIVKQTSSFRDDLLKDLTDTEFAMYYIEAALADYKEDGNIESIWMALRDVVEVQAAVSELSKRTGIDAETLLNMFSDEDATRLLDTFRSLLNALKHRRMIEDLGKYKRKRRDTLNAVKFNQVDPLVGTHDSLEVATYLP